MSGYLAILLSAFAGALASAAFLAIARPAARIATAPARRPFEGGADPAVHAWQRFHVRYFGYALIFLLFDMEMVFMYPWAVVFTEVGWKAFMEMGMFILILVLGILYAWRERAFEWD